MANTVKVSREVKQHEGRKFMTAKGIAEMSGIAHGALTSRLYRMKQEHPDHVHFALKMYDAVECNEIKTYLRRAGKSIAEWMILDKDEDALIQFLKKDIITANTIDKLMPQMDAADMVNAKAYALEYIRKNTKEKSFRI